MSALRRNFSWAWLLVPAVAMVFVVWCAVVRIEHIDAMTRFAGGADLALDPASPTGYAGGLRPMIVPVRDPRGLQWIMQAQELEATGAWRLARVEYDNAPTGREVWSPSPYRWWLVGIGRVESAFSGRPPGAAIERAALWADPLLLVTLILVSAVLAWRVAGPAAAAWCSAGLATLFPIGASFLAGRPDETGLALVCALLSVLPLAGVLSSDAVRARWLWFLGTGLAGGLGIWVNVNLQILVLAGIVVGAGASAWWRRPVTGATAPKVPETTTAPAWRVWSAAGAGVVLVAWLVERAPDRLGLAGARWDMVHPGYALAWLGCGELLARIDGWARRGRITREPMTLVALVLALAAIVAPLALAGRAGLAQMFGPGEALLRVGDLSAEVLGGIGAWLADSGASLATLAAVLPVLAALGIGGWIFMRAASDARVRAGVVFLVGIALVATVGAFFRPGDWAIVVGTLALLALPACRLPRVGLVPRIGAGATIAICVAAGVGVALPPRDDAASPAEVRALIERDLAWWLASQAPEAGAVVLAPPDLTSALIYHGGLRGLGSPYRENEDGFRFSVRLAAASTPDEGQALVDSRGVRYIVVPSWDRFLDEYARLGANQPEKSLIALLHQWLPPRWLRPIPYQLPGVEGFASQSVVIFQVVDLQDNPTALSRLAEYFVESGLIPQARRLGAALKELHPTEPAAHVARAQVAVAVRDAGGFREILEAIIPMLEDGSAETLTWDRRVSLALVLAQARRSELAQVEAQRCLDEMDEMALRTLTNRTLQRYLGLLDSLGLEIADPELRALAVRLLPPELRAE